MSAERDSILRLLDLVEAARRCVVVVGMRRTEFDCDWMLRDLLVHELEVIGEAAAGVPETVKEAHPEVPWNLIRATRNRLVHGYADIDYDFVWETARLEVPALKAQVEMLIEHLQGRP